MKSRAMIAGLLSFAVAFNLSPNAFAQAFQEEFERVLQLKQELALKQAEAERIQAENDRILIEAEAARLKAEARAIESRRGGISQPPAPVEVVPSSGDALAGSNAPTHKLKNGTTLRVSGVLVP